MGDAPGSVAVAVGAARDRQKAGATQQKRTGRVILLLAVVSLVAIFTTAWNAAELLPQSMERGQAFAAWYQQSTEPEVVTRPISEFYLLQQLVRAYLRAPWLMPDSGSTRTERTPPRDGWPFPVKKPERSAGDAPLTLSVTSTAVQAAREREAARHAVPDEDGASDAASAAIYQAALADEEDVAGTEEELDAIPAEGIYPGSERAGGGEG